MSQQWRILVVEGDDALNRNIVATLAQDGYSVKGVTTGGEAIRILWENQQHLVIGDRALPDADGFDLLEWIRTYCPQTRMMMLAAPGSPGKRTRALENGAVAYFEQPIDLRLLKVEVRRLLQQTGFTANLDSFDLLDVIQIINMSRKSIALVVHTGLEEQGLLGFQDGELAWAEYGVLRGEEAFFALAAYKKGMVTQQPWDGAARPNVTQPLSRLILQALQYRSKYEASQQFSGEHRALVDQFAASGDQAMAPAIDALLTEEVDDRPFVFVAEPVEFAGQQALDKHNLASAQGTFHAQRTLPQETPAEGEPKQWWQESARMQRVERAELAQPGAVIGSKEPARKAQETPPTGAQKIASGISAANDEVIANLPDGAIGGNGTSIRPSTVRKTPVGQRTDLPSWLMDQPTQFEVQALRPSSLVGSGKIPVTPVIRSSPAAWQPVTPSVSGTTANLSTAQPHRRNYPALVAALQTVGYTLSGFVAAAVVSMDGQPIAQVAVDDLDISGMCHNFSALLRGALRALDQGTWGQHEDTIITSATYHILLRVPGFVTDVFQVLVTTRESDPVESLDVLATVEGAIISAL
jgi:DNA-binding response OmpR family regulator/predicted regulator of Ras-like GTPase activity (Roadblock/LC7/MglB family)